MKAKKHYIILNGLLYILTLPLLCQGLVFAKESVEVKTKPTQSKTELSGLLETAVGWTSLKDHSVDDRPWLSVHRARFWVKGAVNKQASYVMHFALDRIGADQFAMLQSRPLSTSRAPAIQDAMLHFHILPKKALVLTSGFLRPTVGRENNVAVITEPNMEPALTSGLVRQVTTETGHGRAGGVNLSHFSQYGKFGVLLHLGMFMPTVKGAKEELEYDQSQGSKLNPLFTSTLQLTWGTRMQMANENTLLIFNPLTKSRGIHLGGSIGQQGETERFKQSQVWTVYSMAHWDYLLFDTEWVSAKRISLNDNEAVNSAWHIRAGYNIKLGSHFMTPFILYTQLKGDQLTPEELEGELGALKLYAGEGNLVDAGMNYHFAKRRLRVGIHGIYSTVSKETIRQPLRAGWSTVATFHMHF